MRRMCKMNIPRSEYPRPQLVRKPWKSLNGPWRFAKDQGCSGMDRKLYETTLDDETILVPFCPESKLSGIGFTDFMAAVWYQRDINIPVDWAGRRIRLHFGAVDYHATVWLNGKEVGQHKGGYTPFCFDITDYLRDAGNTLTLCAMDDTRGGKQPKGKQSSKYYSNGCDYTRTTGIWQTVWLEAVDPICVDAVQFTPYAEDGSVLMDIAASQPADYANIEITYQGKAMASSRVAFSGNRATEKLKLTESHLWTVGKGELYDVTITLESQGNVTDRVESYFGLRTITWDQKGIKINGEYIYQRLVLDQGFYPDGIYTAPTDDALKKDIELSLAMGFNGARLHEKIFEPRYLYWADKLGYLCWGEHANWGLDITTMDGLKHFLPEWMEAIRRDYSHPSIVGWCPFNETWNKRRPDAPFDTSSGIPQDDDVLRMTYEVTKAMDTTRPVIDTSGNFHVITDVYDIHCYDQNVEHFKEKLDSKDGVYITFEKRQGHTYTGQPFFVSEYGGIKLSEDESSWGYGNAPESVEEFVERYDGLTTALLQSPKVCAYCYTQLYDVEQEANGLYTYSREAKVDPQVIAKINKQVAAIEETE